MIPMQSQSSLQGNPARRVTPLLACTRPPTSGRTGFCCLEYPKMAPLHPKGSRRLGCNDSCCLETLQKRHCTEREAEHSYLSGPAPREPCLLAGQPSQPPCTCSPAPHILVQETFAFPAGGSAGGNKTCPDLLGVDMTLVQGDVHRTRI